MGGLGECPSAVLGGCLRFTRLTNAFSNEIENPCHMVALYALWYNFVRQHKSLKGLSPAMAAGIETRLWSMDDVVRLIEAREDLRLGALLVGLQDSSTMLN
jgi:hypothetical protein